MAEELEGRAPTRFIDIMFGGGAINDDDDTLFGEGPRRTSRRIAGLPPLPPPSTFYLRWQKIKRKRYLKEKKEAAAAQALLNIHQGAIVNPQRVNSQDNGDDGDNGDNNDDEGPTDTWKKKKEAQKKPVPKKKKVVYKRVSWIGFDPSGNDGEGMSAIRSYEDIPTVWPTSTWNVANSPRRTLMNMYDSIHAIRTNVTAGNLLTAVPLTMATWPTYNPSIIFNGVDIIVTLKIQILYSVTRGGAIHAWFAETWGICLGIRLADPMTVDDLIIQALQYWLDGADFAGPRPSYFETFAEADSGLSAEAIFIQKYTVEIDSHGHRVTHATAGAGLLSHPLAGPLDTWIERLSSLSLSDALTYSSNPDIPHGGRDCVVDYLLWESTCRRQLSHTRFAKWTRPFLKRSLGGAVYPTSQDILTFAVGEGDISVHIIDATLKEVARHIAVKQPCALSLFFMVCDGHCLPITNRRWRHHLSAAKGCVPLNDLVKSPPWELDRALQVPGMAEDVAVTWALEHVTQDISIVVLPINSLGTVLEYFLTAQHEVPTSFEYRAGELMAFKISACTVVAGGGDWEVRKAFCFNAFKRYKCVDLLFHNQSWANMAFSLYSTAFNALPKSSYSTDLVDAWALSPIGPYSSWKHDAEGRPHMTTPSTTMYDIKRAYSSIMRDNNFEYPIFGVLDAKVHWPDGMPTGDTIVPGEYYIQRSWAMAGGALLEDAGWYPAVLVNYALRRGYINKGDIVGMIKACATLPSDTFTTFTQHIHAEFPEESKSLLNRFTGMLGRRARETIRTGICADMETALATLHEIETRELEARISPMGDFYLVQEVAIYPLWNGHIPIYRHILASGHALLDDMYLRLATPSTTVLGFRTDAIIVDGAVRPDAVVPTSGEAAWGDIVFAKRGSDIQPRGYDPFERPVRPREEWAGREPTILSEDDDSWRRIAIDGGLILGQPGCGKTTQLGKLYSTLLADHAEEEVCVTAYTHAACAALRGKGCPSASTFSSLTFLRAPEEGDAPPAPTEGDKPEGELDPARLSRYKWLILDEFTMLPPAEMAILLQATKRYGIKVVAAGDPNQCTAPVGYPVDYVSNPLFLSMVGGNIIPMTYKTGSGRYDAPLKDALGIFQSSGRLSAWVDHPPPPTPTFNHVLGNLCLLNKTRTSLNKAALAVWKGDHPGIPSTTVHWCNRRSLWIAAGLQLMVYHDNLRSRDILKTQLWEVQLFDEEHVTLRNIADDRLLELTSLEVARVFDYAFATTVHKAQGLTIEAPYMVHDVAHFYMSKNVLYTALSRGRSFATVYLAPSTPPAVYGRVYVPTPLNVSRAYTLKELTPLLHRVYIRRSETPSGILYSAEVQPVHRRALGEEDDFFEAGEPDGDAPHEHTGDGAIVPDTPYYILPDSTPALLLAEVKCQALERGEVLVPTPDAVDLIMDTSLSAAAGRFNVAHCVSRSEFKVACTLPGIDEEHALRTFKYCGGNDVSMALAEARATDWSAQMKAHYF